MTTEEFGKGFAWALKEILLGWTADEIVEKEDINPIAMAKLLEIIEEANHAVIEKVRLITRRQSLGS